MESYVIESYNNKSINWQSKNSVDRNRVKKKVNNVILKLINENIVTELEKKKSPTTIYNILKYKLLQSKNAKIDIHNAKHWKASLGKKRRKQRYIAQRLFK